MYEISTVFCPDKKTTTIAFPELMDRGAQPAMGQLSCRLVVGACSGHHHHSSWDLQLTTSQGSVPEDMVYTMLRCTSVRQAQDKEEEQAARPPLA
jgi:hypothetical protein